MPLVLVVGDEPTSGPRPWDVDQIAMASAVGARTYTVGRADAAATTVIAVEHALTYRVPTVLAIPYDVATLDTGPVPETPAPRLPAPLAVRGAFADGVVREIAAALATARRPLLLAGRGAWVAGAGEALGAVADATGALTVTTALGRGIFPRAEFDLGVAGGFGTAGARWRSSARPTSRSSSGASLNQFTMRFGELFAPGCRVFQVDVAPAATHPHVGGYVRGDAARRRARRSSRSSPDVAAQRVARVRRPHGRTTARARGRDRRGRAARPALRSGPPRRAAARGPRGRLGRRALPRLVEHVLAGVRRRTGW